MEGAMQPDQPPTLYDRLGGVYNIATVGIVESTQEAIVVTLPLQTGPPSR
jgi:hypothetical protein